MRWVTGLTLHQDRSYIEMTMKLVNRTSTAGSRTELGRSMLFAAAITAPLCWWGSGASMGLVHSGGPLVLLFLPVIPVMLLFGSGGPFGDVPDWLFNSAAIAAQFAGTLLVVHLIRSYVARRTLK